MSEFLSEDLYGGYIDPVSAFVPNYGLLMSGMPITAQAILGDTAASGLMQTLNTLNDPETQAYYQNLIDNQSSTPQQGSVTTEDVYGVVNPYVSSGDTYFNDQGVEMSNEDLLTQLGYMDSIARLDPAEEMDRLEDETVPVDAVLLSRLREFIAAGNIERAIQEQTADSQELGQEIQELQSILGSYNPETDDPNEFVSQVNEFLTTSDLTDIEGFNDWWQETSNLLVPQEQEAEEKEESIDSPLTGDPGDLFEPDTGLEPDTDFSAPTQRGVNLEDFQTQFPDLNVEDYEDGMYTDPRTGTVYVINIPPGGIPKETEGEGEGEGGSGNGAGGNGSGGEGGEGQQGQEGQGEAGQAGQTGTSGTTDQTRETGNIPDYSDIGDPNYGDDRIPPGDRGVIDDYRPRDPGFQIIAGVPFIGNGSGVEGSSGGSSSGGGDGGMLSQNKFKFTPYTASVRGVNAPQVNVIGGQPQRQSIMGMFQEYLT